MSKLYNADKPVRTGHPTWKDIGRDVRKYFTRGGLETKKRTDKHSKDNNY